MSHGASRNETTANEDRNVTRLFLVLLGGSFPGSIGWRIIVMTNQEKFFQTNQKEEE